MRPISHIHLQAITAVAQPANKWEVLRDLAKAQECYGLRDRDLAVLQALLSFFQGDFLDPSTDLVVFASNRAICDRLNGMPDSTMRRHLAKLVNCGVIERRDSPNGKRFRIKGTDEQLAFGLDLSPLPRMATQLKDQADTLRAAEARIKRLRMRISLMRRDLLAISTYGASLAPDETIWQEATTLAALATLTLRRKLDLEGLTSLSMRLSTMLDRCSSAVKIEKSAEVSTTAAQNEQHHQKSKKEDKILDSAEKQLSVEDTSLEDERLKSKDSYNKVPPLHLVTKACPDLVVFSGSTVETWGQLFSAATRLCPALGIRLPTWNDAVRLMGPESASVVVAALLQRFSEIRSPGAYLRRLTIQASQGKFSCVPMIGSLLEPKATT